jgi:hypothetical protein
MKRSLLIAVLFACAVITSTAQSEMQALRYSQYYPFGTSRYAAQGGAIGALGGDLSAILENPAGLGLFRSSEFSFSPSIYWVNTTAGFMGNSTDDSRMKFNVGNLGYVSATTMGSGKGLAGVAFSLGYNTLVNFNNRTRISAVNNNSSLLDDFTWHANADPGNLSPFYEELAFEANLMPYDSAAGEFWHDMQLDGYGQEQYRLSDQSGYIGEYSVSGAFNFSDLLYVGATLGIHAVRFNEEITHMETDTDNHVLDFSSFRFREFNYTRGWGYTFRMGMILRPLQLIRLGASFQIPTYYHLTDEKFTDMNSYWDNGSGIQDTRVTSPNGYYDYELKTPFRVNGHASLILFKLATLSAGYEYVDYSSARLEADDDKFFEENDGIREDFRATHNLKAGAEVRLGSLYLRGGAQYLMSPFTDTRNNAETWVYAGGLGFRSQDVYFDISYSRSHARRFTGFTPLNLV